MKNILIPTILEEDTICAVRTAIAQLRGRQDHIVLMLLKEVPDTYSAAASLSNMNFTCTKEQQNVLSKCRKLFNDANSKLSIHYQFSISAPLLRNVMQHFDCSLVILTPSFRNSRERENRHLVKVLLKSKYPLLHLNSIQVQTLTNALYIEHKSSRFTVQELQQMLNNTFNFRIISRTKVSDELSLHDANPIIAEAISHKQIDLLVETRKVNQKVSAGQLTTPVLKFGVPVLSIYEEDLLN